MDTQTWNSKTWFNFKIHFTQAHIKLHKKVASTSELSFHYASVIINQIVKQLEMDTVNNNPPPQIHSPEPAENPSTPSSF